MTHSESDPTEQSAALPTVPGALNLLSGDDAGYCAGGVCHIPAQHAQKTP